MTDSAKKLIKAPLGIWKRVKIKIFILIDFVYSLVEYWLGPNGRRSTPSQRLIPIGNPPISGTNPARIAIFVAYSRRLSLSSKAYLAALRKAGFAIIYINNETTDTDAIASISSLTWRAFDRRNIGRDFGAFKDGILLLLKEGSLQHCQALCIVNDSMQFIPGRNANALIDSIEVFLKSSKSALFSHISHQIQTHYQSYFQILKPEVFLSRPFIGFWTNYLPLSHRGHCIYNGEVALSEKVYRRCKSTETLYTSDKLLEAIEQSCDKGTGVLAEEVFRLMPSPARTSQMKKIGYSLNQLMLKSDKNEPLSKVELFSIPDLIENGNPSHIAAFLYPFYLYCPFVKHDLGTAGTYTIAQAISLFKEALCLSLGEGQILEINALTDEFRDLIYDRGVPMSYSNRLREAALKGITGAFVYPSTYQ
ncbi:hypothetical protein [Synechococcus sp. CS-1332]|uniref:hypothetical protein n=1 Tax=Synechococcus sp. CS-1332 TaxID=2847972 RepID=UPI00223B6287|nr:hypothetical protein [Synechococcus sp. CS-1332]MCT0208481.1 hypothetical protein [Synechococcus sp. CS-1332]